MTVLRNDHLRSAPVVVDVGVRTEWEPPTLRAALWFSTRPAWAPPRWLLGSPRRLSVTSGLVALSGATTTASKGSRIVRMVQGWRGIQSVIDLLVISRLAGCGRRCATLSRWTGSLWWPTAQLAISHRRLIVDVHRAGYLQMRSRTLGSLEVSRAHVLSGIAVGILSLNLRTVISRGRDEHGAVEKTLKRIHTICTVLVFPVVVALSWTIYNGVKRLRYSGSVVPSMPSASGIPIFIHDEAHGGCSTRVKVLSMDWYPS